MIYKLGKIVRNRKDMIPGDSLPRKQKNTAPQNKEASVGQG
jgi:hypothetical protein